LLLRFRCLTIYRDRKLSGAFSCRAASSRGEAGSTAPVLKDLLFKGYELGIKVKFVPITIDDYESWVKRNLNNDISSIF
jgi:hypothetical protein